MDARPNVMSFDIVGTIITFSKEDFLLIIGLWLSPVRKVLNKKHIFTTCTQNKYFKNIERMHPTDLEGV